MKRNVSFLALCLMIFVQVSYSEGVAKSKEANPRVVLATNHGDIELELYPEKAPVTVKNFVRYVEEGFYNGTVFHRVIPNFMIQGGGMTSSMDQKKTHEPIKNEATNGLSNEVGTVAMARTSVVDSATSQFFINVNENKFLDHRNNSPSQYGYAVFGKVTKGMATVNKIRMVKTGNKGPHQNVPSDPVVIQSAKVVAAKKK